MDITKLFNKLAHDHPELFCVNSGVRLELKNCMWIIAMSSDNDVLVHDLRGITTESFKLDRIKDRIVLMYDHWQTRFYNDEIEAEQVILASAIHYNEIYPQAVKEHHNKQIEQALNNLD